MNNGSALIVGSSVVDLTFYTSTLPKPGETTLGTFKQGLGGKGFNQAIATKLSGTDNTTFISAVGTDLFSESFISKLNLLGIQNHLISNSQASTGMASIVVDSNGQNSIVVDLGASASLDFNSIVTFLDSAFNVILFQFETNLELLDLSLSYLMNREDRDNITVIVNPAPASFWNTEWLNKIDILTPNETELQTIFGITSLRSNSIPKELIGKRCHVINTLGANGVCWYNKNTNSLLYFDAINVETVVDTSGAGDAFNGGLVTGLLNNNGDINESIKFANVVGGLSVTKQGTSSSFPTEEEIFNFLNYSGV